MINQILQGINNLQQIAQAGGEGVGTQTDKTTSILQAGTPPTTVPALTQAGRLIKLHDGIQKQTGSEYVVPGLSPEYSTLFISVSAKDSGGLSNVNLQFNGDTTGTYNTQLMAAFSTTFQGGLSYNQTSLGILVTDAGSVTFPAGFIVLPNYAMSDRYKTALGFSGYFGDGASVDGTGMYITFRYGIWENQNPIKQIRFFTGNNVVAGSRFTIWGFK